MCWVINYGGSDVMYFRGWNKGNLPTFGANRKNAARFSSRLEALDEVEKMGDTTGGMCEVEEFVDRDLQI